MRIEWDEEKNLSNLHKHSIRFEQAQEIFLSGGDYIEIFDDEHSEDEDRFIAIGPTQPGVVVVVWTERYDDTIRILSARWATRRETRLYQSCLDAFR